MKEIYQMNIEKKSKNLVLSRMEEKEKEGGNFVRNNRLYFLQMSVHKFGTLH